jgi:hypothetical protein
MIVKLALSALFLALACVGIVQRKEARRIGLAIVLLSAAALAAIWNDTAVTRLANWVGVGRGTDLILYIWIPISLAFAMLLYVRVVALEHMLTQLCRHIAIESPAHVPTSHEQ